MRLLLLLSLCVALAGAASAQQRAPLDIPATTRLLPRKPIDGHMLGGLSGLAWDQRTATLVAVSDRGDVFSLPRTPDTSPQFVASLKRPRRVSDPESLRRSPDG
ncbi:MAG: hypothetical protein ACKVH0_07235, partial [Alphaproteobacteria bacterium]